MSSTLPDDLVVEIGFYLERDDLNKMKKISKHMNDIICGKFYEIKLKQLKISSENIFKMVEKHYLNKIKKLLTTDKDVSRKLTKILDNKTINFNQVVYVDNDFYPIREYFPLDLAFKRYNCSPYTFRVIIDILISNGVNIINKFTFEDIETPSIYYSDMYKKKILYHRINKIKIKLN